MFVVLAVPILPAQDGPRLVQNQRDDFLIPPAPGDSESTAADRDAEAGAAVPQPPEPALGQPDRAAPDDLRIQEDATPDPRGVADRAAPPADGPRENYLGVFTEALPPVLADQFASILAPGEGLLVTGVVNGAAADQAGLRAHDVLVSYNAQPLTSPDDLKRLVVADEPGATAELTVIRSAEKQTIPVTLGERSVAPPRRPAPVAAAPLPRDPFPIGVHLPGNRSIIVGRFGLRSPWVSVDWGSPLAGRRFQALAPDGRQFDVEVRVHPGRVRSPYWRY
jgi:hypothetical protein